MIEEIKKLKKRKKHSIVWDEEQSKERFEKEAEGRLPVLEETQSRKIETKPFESNNILIDDDN